MPSVGSRCGFRFRLARLSKVDVGFLVTCWNESDFCGVGSTKESKAWSTECTSGVESIVYSGHEVGVELLFE